MGDALHTDGGVTSAQEARIADAGLLALDGPGAFDVRTGVFFGPGSTSLVSGTTTTAPSWTYQIATCNWVTSRGASNGPYRGALEQATTVDTALPPASNSRIDVIWVKQADAAAGVPSPDGTTEPVYGVTSGAAAPSPSKPAIPVGAVEIATAVVPSTATGGTGGSGVVITQTARQTVARGADIPVRSQAERDALEKYDGLAVKRLDQGGAQESYVNGAWQPTGNQRQHFQATRIFFSIPSGSGGNYGVQGAAIPGLFTPIGGGVRVEKAGVYAVSTGVLAGSGLGSDGYLFLRLGNDLSNVLDGQRPNGSNAKRLNVSTTVALSAGDEISHLILQNTGSTQNIDAWFRITRLSD